MTLSSALIRSTAVAALGGLLFGFDTAVIAGTATAVSGNVARRQQARAQQAAAAEAYEQQQVAANMVAAPATDVVSQLKDLAALRDSGVLTDDEFAAQKARILGS